MGRAKWIRVVCAGLVGAAAFAVYWNNLDDYFVADDFDLIQSFQGQPPSYFLKLLVNDESNWIWDPIHESPMVRPIKIWLLRLDQLVWGAQGATGFHITGTLFFALVAILMFLVADQLFPGRLELAVLAGLVTAVHPVFSEIVPSITFREETITTAFSLAAFLCFLRHRNGEGSAVGFPVFFALAMLTKESGAFFLPIPLAYDFLHVVFAQKRSEEVRKRYRAYVPVALVVIAYAVLRWAGFGEALGASSQLAGYWVPFRFVVFLVAILRFFVHPNMLAVPSWFPLLSVLCLASVAFAITLWLNRHRLGREYWITLLFVGPGWYIVTALALYGIYFDARHNVLPVLGAILFGVALVAGATAGSRRVVRALVFSFSAVIALAIFLPPTLALSREYEKASQAVENTRLDIENQTRHLPDGSKILLVNVPQFPIPPYYFGWGLLSSLKKPFTQTDLANRMLVVSLAERRLNGRPHPGPTRYDFTYISEERFQVPPWPWEELRTDTGRKLFRAKNRLIP